MFPASPRDVDGRAILYLSAMHCFQRRGTPGAAPPLSAFGCDVYTVPMTQDLRCIGLDLGDWTRTVEAAINSNTLGVVGETKGGQLVQYNDPSGARISILTSEPYAVFSGFTGSTVVTAHVTMVNDVLALLDVVNDDGYHVASLTANLAQGPLLVDSEPLQFEAVELTALAFNATVEPTGDCEPSIESPGAKLIDAGSGAAVPDASASLTAPIVMADYRTSELTGQRFIHAVVHEPLPMDICLPDAAELPAKGDILTGTVMLTGSVSVASSGCGGGCGGDGCGGGGCGGGGCGGH